MPASSAPPAESGATGPPFDPHPGLFCRWPRDRQRRQTQFARTKRLRAEQRAERRRQSADLPAPTPLPLEADQRIAQIRHARANGFAAWEIAVLVPGPVTAVERDAARKETTA